MAAPDSAARKRTFVYSTLFALRPVLILAGLGTAMCLQACQTRYVAHSRTVTATAYTLRANEGGFDDQAGVGAWGAQLADHPHSIAVSRDLLEAGLTRGSKVWIDGLDGTWVVRDKMNRRWKNRIDILMPGDVRKAREWGRRKVTIRWYTPRQQGSNQSAHD